MGNIDKKFYENLALFHFNNDGLLEWNHKQWSELFAKASEDKDSFNLHFLRREVFNSTLMIVRNGSYVCDSGETVNLDLNDNIELQTKFYADEINIHGKTGHYDTEVYAVNDDCLSYARSITTTDGDVCVLNMANRRNPGGGVVNGAGAQEEYLFRCSDYYRSLYSFISYASMYGVERSEKSYPLDRNFGGIFTPMVTVFRGLEEDGYPLLLNPWKVNMVAVPAMSNPRCISVGGEYRVAPDLEEGVKNKMRAILRIAAVNNQETLVLGALGCGAFRNPPRHTAEMFKEIINEPEFNGLFKTICFAIKEDHNSRGEGNFAPFADIFGTK